MSCAHEGFLFSAIPHTGKQGSASCKKYQLIAKVTSTEKGVSKVILAHREQSLGRLEQSVI